MACWIGHRSDRLLLAAVASTLVWLLLSAVATGAPGDLDRNFGTHGKVVRDFGEGDDAGSVAIQDDGRIVVAGDIVRRDPRSHRRASVLTVARFRPGGRVDRSFAGDGFRTIDVPGTHDFNADVAIQENGRIVVAGDTGIADMWDGPRYSFAVVRLRPGGRLDRTFAGDGIQVTPFDNDEDGFGGYALAYGMAIQENGRIIVVGSSHPPAPAKSSRASALAETAAAESSPASPGAGAPEEVGLAVARYLPNGRLDRSFAGDGRQTTELAGVALEATVQDDGRILAVGSEYDEAAIARFNPDGTLDQTFAADGVVATDLGFAVDSVEGVTVADDGGIVIAGGNGELSGGFVLARLSADGELDPAFAGDGIQTTDFRRGSEAEALAVDDDRRLLVVGTTRARGGSSDLALARYLPDGRRDRSFGEKGRRTTDFSGRTDHGYDVAITARGRIRAAGQSNGDTALAGYLGR
jgi:uncharacterized delta-60 repeat protein